MAWAVNKAMAQGLAVVLSGHLGTVIATGKITHKQRSKVHGIVVYVEGTPDPIPLPFIKKMALQKGTVGSDSHRRSAAGAPTAS